MKRRSSSPEAGTLQHLVTFRVKPLPEDVDTFGEPDEEFVDTFDVWAAIEFLGTQEFPVTQKRFAETTVRFRVRYDPRIYTTHAADKLQIVTALDPAASPVVTSVWNIQQPIPIDGLLVELHIEASEVK